MTTPSYPPQTTDEPTPNDGRPVPARLAGVVVAVVVTLGILALALTLASAARPQRPLYPALATPTPPERLITSAPETVTFAALNENPAAFLNQTLEVTGDYTPVDVPDCRPLAGPMIAWSLVADSLQLNAVGFERVLRLVEPGTMMTVEGMWTLYDGPAGCGKQPEDDVIWYLAVSKIIAPNPLFGGPEAVLTFVPGDATAAVELVPTVATTPDLTSPNEATPETPEPTLPGTTPGVVNTPVPTATGLPVTPLPTLPGGGTTPLPPTPGTPGSGSTVTPTPDPNATPTSGPGGGSTPGIPTATPDPDGYPAPPTQPPGGYP